MIHEHELFHRVHRLWYTLDTSSSSKGAGNIVPLQIGYMNVIPKCLDSASKYPLYENLPETYAATNEYLSQNPLEGKQPTVEHLSQNPLEGRQPPTSTCRKTH